MHMQFVICGNVTCRFHLLVSDAEEIALKLVSEIQRNLLTPTLPLVCDCVTLVTGYCNLM